MFSPRRAGRGGGVRQSSHFHRESRARRRTRMHRAAPAAAAVARAPAPYPRSAHDAGKEYSKSASLTRMAASSPQGKLTVGYWSIRGLGAPLRMMCEFAGADYEVSSRALRGLCKLSHPLAVVKVASVRRLSITTRSPRRAEVGTPATGSTKSRR